MKVDRQINREKEGELGERQSYILTKHRKIDRMKIGERKTDIQKKQTEGR